MESYGVAFQMKAADYLFSVALPVKNLFFPYHLGQTFSITRNIMCSMVKTPTKKEKRKQRSGCCFSKLKTLKILNCEPCAKSNS